MKRPPIVVVMGHIDHGKTTLLDKIRETNVAGKEIGGITQHIGACQVEVKGKKITFIDTPGHEAFSKMRSRGAKVADVALLVVAADDGVRPQTEEALRVIQEEKLPFIVVLNKIDKESADPERVKKELGDRGVILEEWGGKVPLAKISAKTGEGIGELLELVLLLAELENLEYDPSRRASGTVIESHLDSKRGNAATLLLRDGVLRKGDWVLVEDAWVRTKILEDFNGRRVTQAFASSPVRVVGFDKPARVGSLFYSFESKEEFEKALKRAPDAKASQKPPRAEGEKIIPLVLKADTAGSLEALESGLGKIDPRDFSMTILRAEVGAITEDDIKLASASQNSLVLGFRVKADQKVSLWAERFGVRVGSFGLIYELEDWLGGELSKIIGVQKVKKILGRATVLKIFKEDGSKKIIGGRVVSGSLLPQKQFILFRRDFPLGEGKVLELQIRKLKVKEVLAGQEFGALVELPLEVAPGDQLEIFEVT